MTNLALHKGQILRYTRRIKKTPRGNAKHEEKTIRKLAPRREVCYNEARKEEFPMKYVLKFFQIILWLVLLPVRGLLCLISYALEFFVQLGAIITTLAASILTLLVLLALLTGDSIPNPWLTIGSIAVVAVLPYIAAYVAAMPMALAELLGELTSPLSGYFS